MLPENRKDALDQKHAGENEFKETERELLFFFSFTWIFID